ncbi:MAG: helix-turn-helix transcriptional regulator [Kineosporiaceae bacterium]
MSEISPTAQRREVGSLLRAHRERVGLTAVEVAGRVGISAAKLSRLERGLRGLQIADVRSLCAVYELSEDETRELIAATRASREPGWWTEFSALGADAPRVFGLESAADSSEEYAAILVPGLLQTADYARAVISQVRPDADFSEAVVSERVEARMMRSSLLLPVLDRRVHFVIDESVLLRCVGSAEIMSAQLRELVLASERPNVILQILPFAVGAHAGVEGSFVVHGFGDAIQRDVVFVEGLSGTLLIDNHTQVEAYRRAFSAVAQQALDPEASRRRLCTVERQWQAS